MRYNASGRSWNIKYLLHPYLLSKARIVNRRWHKQWEFCVTGGGDVWNGYHQSLNEASIAFGRTADKSIGQKWGTRVVNGSVKSTLSLNVGAGPVSIGASTDVADKDRHTGSTGHDGDIGSVSGMERFNENRVNVAYKSGSTWRWQGSGDFQGNNGHLLVELLQSDTATASWWLFATNRAHCSHPFGIRCGNYN